MADITPVDPTVQNVPSASQFVAESEGENGVDLTSANEYKERSEQTSKAVAAWNAEYQIWSAGNKLRARASNATIPVS